MASQVRLGAHDTVVHDHGLARHGPSGEPQLVHQGPEGIVPHARVVVDLGRSRLIPHGRRVERAGHELSARAIRRLQERHRTPPSEAGFQPVGRHEPPGAASDDSDPVHGPPPVPWWRIPSRDHGDESERGWTSGGSEPPGRRRGGKARRRCPGGDPGRGSPTASAANGGVPTPRHRSPGPWPGTAERCAPGRCHTSGAVPGGAAPAPSPPGAAPPPPPRGAPGR